MNSHLIAVKKRDKDGKVVTRHIRPETMKTSSTAIPAVVSDSLGRQAVTSALQKTLTAEALTSGYSKARQKRILTCAAELPEDTLRYLSSVLESEEHFHYASVWNASMIAELLNAGMDAKQIEDRVFLSQHLMDELGSFYLDVEVDEFDGTQMPRELTFGQYWREPLEEILRGMGSYGLDEMPYSFDRESEQPLRARDQKIQDDFGLIARMTLKLSDGSTNSHAIREKVDGEWMMRIRDTADVQTLLQNPQHSERISYLYTWLSYRDINGMVSEVHTSHVPALLDLLEAERKHGWSEDLAEKDRLCDGGDVNEETGEITYSVDLYGPRMTQLASTYPNKTDVIIEFITHENNGVIPAADSPELLKFIEYDSPALRVGRL